MHEVHFCISSHIHHFNNQRQVEISPHNTTYMHQALHKQVCSMHINIEIFYMHLHPGSKYKPCYVGLIYCICRANVDKHTCVQVLKTPLWVNSPWTLRTHIIFPLDNCSWMTTPTDNFHPGKLPTTASAPQTTFPTRQCGSYPVWGLSRWESSGREFPRNTVDIYHLKNVCESHNWFLNQGYPFQHKIISWLISGFISLLAH